MQSDAIDWRRPMRRIRASREDVFLCAVVVRSIKVDVCIEVAPPN